jgi:16S rRNA (guanine1516-N2)-methyltransferase
MTQLLPTPQGLALRIAFGDMKPLIIDFASAQNQWRQKTSGKKQPLAKACGIKKAPYPHIVDCTAGLGRDAFVLASLGCTVDMLERNDTLHALLNDGLLRAQNDEKISDVCRRLTLVNADARHWLQTTTQAIDVIYCDPMFPDLKKSALVKKEMQILQHVIGDDQDADHLLSIALTKAARVVVKRHRHAPWLAQKKPNFDVSGKTVRYDIYLREAK